MKLRRLRINENLNPSETFRYELKMTRAEIAQDISRFSGNDINETDSRLTDDLCEAWLKFDLDFISRSQDDQLIKLREVAIKNLLKKAEIKVERSKVGDNESSISEEQI